MKKRELLEKIVERSLTRDPIFEILGIIDGYEVITVYITVGIIAKISWHKENKKGNIEFLGTDIVINSTLGRGLLKKLKKNTESKNYKKKLKKNEN